MSELDDQWHEERWACPPPPEGSTYRVLRDEWSADFRVRTIHEWAWIQARDERLGRRTEED